eukprot:GGOE01014227.1.p1 GENE.GGOE01014227.1~~GGOE01014227.1.p1  ORF type:complete len:321 (+),score=75.59 GGOE01014227.1:39-965(+)
MAATVHEVQAASPQVAMPSHPMWLALGRFVIAAASSCIAETCSYPMDTIKTQMQLCTRTGAERRSILAHGREVVRCGGWRGLFVGLEPALVRQFIQTGCNYVVYDIVKSWLGATEDHLLWKKITAGIAAGVVGQLVSTPADVVKVRLQGDLRAGLTPRYRNAFHALNCIAREEGVRGLWRGLSASMQRSATLQPIGLVIYDQFKHTMQVHGIQDGVATQMFCASIASASGAVASTPFDVAKSRMMNTSSAASAYKTTYHCMMLTARQEGITALWKGTVGNYCRMVIWQATFYPVYEWACWAVLRKPGI